MSEVAPWRALEDPTPGTGDAGGVAAGSAPAAAGGLGRAPWVMAVLAVAVLVGMLAIWLVASGGRGSLVVEGDRPVPRGSSVAAGPGGDGRSLDPGASARIVVDVQGAVVRPGIVELAPGARVADAIAAAGGFGPRVAADRVGQALNLAALVKDGDQITVPSRDDPAVAPTTGSGGTGGGSGGGSGGTGPVDLNRATVAELDALPGIGPVTAAKIIAAREEQAFASVDDLRTRKILGAATFDKVKDLVVVR